MCEDRSRQEVLHSVMFPCFPLLVALENCKSTCTPHVKSFLVSTALTVIRVFLLLFITLFLLVTVNFGTSREASRLVGAEKVLARWCRLHVPLGRRSF